jgi:serine/threonine protein kinase
MANIQPSLPYGKLATVRRRAIRQARLRGIFVLMTAPSIQLPENFADVTLLGSGGMGSVYSAQDETMNRKVAIKVIQSGHLSADQLKRFRSEAKSMSQLAHSNIIKVLSVGLLDNVQPYMVLEYVDGEPLDKVLERDGKFTVERAIPIFRQIAEALHHAHSKGIIHRDIKPSNVMLVRQSDGHDSVKLLDFGIARDIMNSVHLTGTGNMIGSPAYASPEQCMAKKIDARSDIYSLGCLMYQVLTGRTPFESESAMELVLQQCSTDAEPLQDVPEGMDRIVRRCLMKSPDNRFQTAADLTAALDSGDTAIATIVGKKTNPLRKFLPYIFVALAAVGALIAIGLQPHGQPNSVVQTTPGLQMDRADAFLESGRWVEGDNAYSVLINQDDGTHPVHLFDLYYKRAHCRLGIHSELAMAESDFRKAMELVKKKHPPETSREDFRKCVQGIAVSLQYRYKDIQAEPHFRSARLDAPNSELALIDFSIGLGQEQRGAKDIKCYAEAERLFKQALAESNQFPSRDNPTAAKVYAHLAAVQYGQKKFKEAVNSYRTLEKLFRETGDKKSAELTEAKVKELEAAI